jgi:hypothetical protein
VIKYCLGALFLVACGSVGTVKDPPVYDPMDTITPIPHKYAEPAPRKHAQPARTHQSQHRCDAAFEDKKAEILYRIDCLAEGVGGA